jgi:hypothetical protein
MTAQQVLTEAQELLDGLKAVHEEQTAAKNCADRLARHIAETPQAAATGKGN